MANARQFMAARTGAWSKAGGSYPWDYRLEYFTTSRTVEQHITTDIDGSNGTVFVGRLGINSLTPYSSSYGGGFYGNVSTSPSIKRHGLGFGGANNVKWQLIWGGGGSQPPSYNAGYVYDTVHTISLGRLHNVSCVIKPGEQKLEVDGKVLHNYSYQTPYYSYPNERFTLFDWTVNGAVQGRPGWIIVGEWKFYYPSDTDSPIHDYIPCVKDGVVCFYDSVKKEFVYNEGSGSFTAGPRVNDDGTPT